MLMLLKNPLFWISIGVIIIALEFIIPGVYLLWIGLGAVFVALPTYLVDDLPVYVALLFLVPSILLTVWIGMLWRGKPKKEAPKVTISLTTYVGTRVPVVAGSAAAGGIRIRLAGDVYPAQSDEPVEAGDYVTIKKVSHHQIFVSPD